MDNHGRVTIIIKQFLYKGIPILRVISICAAAVLGTQNQGAGSDMELLIIGPGRGQLHLLLQSLPSQASFLHMWDSNLVLGIIGSSCHPSSWPLFHIWNAMCVVRPVLCSWPLVSPLGLGLRTLFTEDTASGFIMAVFQNTVPRKCPQNQTLVLNLGLWVQGMSPTQGNQTCHDVGKCRQPGVALSLRLVCLPCSIGSCLLRTWSTPGLPCMGTLMWWA